MQQQTLTPSSISNAIHDEEILVVKRTALFHGSAWQGLKYIPLDEFQESINHKMEFLPRSRMEQDPRYKQIIPYLIFKFEDTYFLMQRQANASEQRLRNKFSLGIGGHIRQEDIKGLSIMDWAKREFNEEVNYRGSYSVTHLGILNDDSTTVGEVHLGCILLLEGNSSDISIKSELNSGRLVTLSECSTHYDNLEQWSQIVFLALERRAKQQQ